MTWWETLLGGLCVPGMHKDFMGEKNDPDAIELEQKMVH